MTTKKQRREKVAARRAVYDAESIRMGLEAQRMDVLRREQRMDNAERSATTRKNKAAMRKIKDAPIPDNVALSYANAIPGLDRPDE